MLRTLSKISPLVFLSSLLVVGCGETDLSSTRGVVERDLPFELVLDSRLDPELVPGGSGAGEWNSESPSPINQFLKPAAISYLQTADARDKHGPDATAALLHYFGNSGEDLELAVDRMIDDLGSLRTIWNELIPALVERLSAEPADSFVFTSDRAAGGYIARSESENWYLAVAGYKYYVKGTVSTIDAQRRAEIELHLWDRYDWDPGVVVPIDTPFGQIDIDQDRIGEFHRQGLAREFDSRGFVVSRTIIEL